MFDVFFGLAFKVDVGFFDEEGFDPAVVLEEGELVVGGFI